MNNRTTAAIVAILLCAICPAHSFAKETKNRNDSVLQVYLSMDVPNLVLPAVQYAIFDKDPIPAFKASLKKLKPFHQKELGKHKNENMRRISRQTFLAMHWNMGFQAVRGDRVDLLMSAPGLTQSIVASSAGGKKWLVTKTRYMGKKLICWCLQYEVKAGEKNEIVISEKNAFDLNAVYKEIMSASKP